MYICWAAANCRHRCGAGERLSSWSSAVRAWKLRRMLPSASPSVARCCAFCHVCWTRQRRESTKIQIAATRAGLPGSGCTAGGSVPGAAAGCLARPSSSARSPQGAAPTARLSAHFIFSRDAASPTKSIQPAHPAVDGGVGVQAAQYADVPSPAWVYQASTLSAHPSPISTTPPLHSRPWMGPHFTGTASRCDNDDCCFGLRTLLGPAAVA